MKDLELRYVAHVTTLSGCLAERHHTEADTIRQLVDELDGIYPGFRQMFVHPGAGTLNLNVMIYYGAPGEVPVSILDLDHRIVDGSVLTFW